MTKPVEELEIKVAFLEDAISKLSDEFYLQQRELENLKAQQAALLDKLNSNSAEESSAAQMPDERPPHY